MLYTVHFTSLLILNANLNNAKVFESIFYSLSKYICIKNSNKAQSFALHSSCASECRPLNTSVRGWVFIPSGKGREKERQRGSPSILPSAARSCKHRSSICVCKGLGSAVRSEELQYVCLLRFHKKRSGLYQISKWFLSTTSVCCNS